MSDLTVERLKEVLRYEPETGLFWWKVKTSKRTNLTKPAGSNHNAGYYKIGIDGNVYLSHRLAWLYMTGKWPEYDIDHINGNKKDNRIENLRDIPHQMNGGNRRILNKNNTTGSQNIYFDKYRCKYVVEMYVAGKKKHFGRFDSLEEATSMATEMRRKHQPGCTI